MLLRPKLDKKCRVGSILQIKGTEYTIRIIEIEQSSNYIRYRNFKNSTIENDKLNKINEMINDVKSNLIMIKY